MNATTELEQALFEKIRQLSEAKQRAVLAFVEQQETSVEAPSAQTDWLESARALRRQLREKYGENHFGSVQDTIDAVREERLDDLMGN
jgi:hypothetical protein